jgi:hypothetical protein
VISFVQVCGISGDSGVFKNGESSTFLVEYLIIIFVISSFGRSLGNINVVVMGGEGKEGLSSVSSGALYSKSITFRTDCGSLDFKKGVLYKLDLYCKDSYFGGDI